MLRRIEYFLLLVSFLSIPAIVGFVIYTLAGQTLCNINLSFLLTCIGGSSVLLLLATGGIMWILAIIVYLLGKIFRRD